MRDLTITITDEQDAAALAHGPSITVEQVIADRLADLVKSAEGVRAQQREAKLAQLDDKGKQAIEAIAKQQAAELEAAIDAEVAKLPAAEAGVKL